MYKTILTYRFIKKKKPSPYQTFTKFFSTYVYMGNRG